MSNSKNTSKAIPVTENGDPVMDFANEFMNNEIFKSRTDLVQWVVRTGRKNGFLVKIINSDQGTNGKNPRLTLACERSGSYKPKQDKSEFKRTSSGTKTCNCPFKLKGRKLPKDDEWSLEVVCGVHNHPVSSEYVEGHSYAGRLNEEETSLLVDLSKSLVPPRDILNTLKERDPLNATTMRTIYNARQKHRVCKRSGKLRMQDILVKLNEHNYVEFHKTCEDDSDTVTDLFWSHPRSIDLLRTFPSILMLDSTFNTERYRFSLFEISGVTSTNTTFSIAFVFVAKECIESYTWALERLQFIIAENGCKLPDVIVSNKDLDLMNAISKVFPSARHLLCKSSIEKNIVAKCKKWFDDKDVVDQFLNLWKVIGRAKCEAEYKKYKEALLEHFKLYPEVVQYVQDDWLDPYGDRFVEAMTNKIMHFGNTTTNRALDSVHSKLKRQLDSSLPDFDSGWPKIHDLLELQFTDIKASFEKSMTVVQPKFKPVEFRELRGFITIAALEILLKQSRLADRIGENSSDCGCVARTTCGLPCAHEIATLKREGKPIPLHSIDPYWKQLDIIPAKVKYHEPDYIAEFEKYAALLYEYDVPTRMEMMKKIEDVFSQFPKPNENPTIMVQDNVTPMKTSVNISPINNSGVSELNAPPVFSVTPLQTLVNISNTENSTASELQVCQDSTMINGAHQLSVAFASTGSIDSTGCIEATFTPMELEILETNNLGTAKLQIRQNTTKQVGLDSGLVQSSDHTGDNGTS